MLNSVLIKCLGDNVSIRRQMLVVIMIGVILICLSGSFLTAWISTQKLYDASLSHATEKVNLLAESALPGLSDTEQARRLISKTTSQKSVIGAALLDAEGKIIAAEPAKDESLELVQTSITEAQAPWDLQTRDYFLLVKTLHQPGTMQKLGSVVIKVSKQPLQSARLDVFLMTFSVGAAISVFLVGLVNITINRFTQPIYRLADLMKESKHTGMHLLSQEEGPKEIKEMAQAYNAMIRYLDDQEEQLRKYSEQLEHQVEIRTQELVNARDAALTASRHKSAFLANITHELRTPIQAIIGYIDLVKEELELEGLFDYSKDLNKVQRSSERLLTLINDILDLSKVEAGKMDVKITVVEVKPLIQQAVDTITPLLDVHQNLLVGPQNETELFIEADKNMLQQIIVNLLSNACKFTRQGTISIDYFSDQSDFYIQIKDSGCGIAPDKIEEIFDEFRQVNRSKKVHEPVSAKKFDGTGLGLAISQKFANLMGGAITVESQLGEGSQFTVKLPL